ncbi:MAG: CotH kinase family protein [Deltaproteobacteria bacterium]|nr:CotH kinase family protein [Deltaproteobacteria bacterium]
MKPRLYQNPLLFRLLGLPIALLIVQGGACARDDSVSCNGDDPKIERPSNWEVESHCTGVEPDYDKLFSDKVVHRFDITMSAKHHRIALDDLEAKLSGGGPGEDPDGLPAPIWVPVTVRFEGKTWEKVGMRWKGHSSLRAAYQAGIRKLAFRLNFDKFEDIYPNLKNQRFFGFKKMTFSNGYKDASLIRDKLAADIFRDGGVPAPRGTFARVYLDFGEGSVYIGLYAMIEDPSNRMLDNQFQDDRGKLYKPWGDPAAWLSLDELAELDGAAGGGGQSLVMRYFKRSDIPYSTFLQLNESDFSEIIGTLHVLHAGREVPQIWRSNLEATFNVKRFLKWLAINQTMVNWDAYGCMHHNYYLYADPTDNRRLTWFPWDMNESMRMHTQPGCVDPGSVMLDEIVNPDPNDTELVWNWPLIRFILGDPEYRKIYRSELKAALEGAFEIDRVYERMDYLHDLISPYVVGPKAEESAPYTNLNDPEDFTNSLTEAEDALKPHVKKRHEAVKEALRQ